MGKRVAGSRKDRERDELLDGAMVVVALVASEKGIEVRLQNRMGVDDEDIALALREASDQLKGVNDRARGCW